MVADGGNPTAAAAMGAEKRRVERWLFCATAATTAAGSFVMTAMDQIFLDHYAGDFAAHGRLMAWIGSTSSALSFLFKPLLGVLPPKTHINMLA